MTPEHHEERLRTWAVHTGKPVISIDYGKAPECEFLFKFDWMVGSMSKLSPDPYPFAIDEAFDTYKAIVESS